MICVTTLKKSQWDVILHNDIGKILKNLHIPSTEENKCLDAGGRGVNGLVESDLVSE